MEVLKEYAGVATLLVTVVAALGALGLWAINAQVTPEINRLEARIDVHEALLRQIDRKIDASVKDRNERFDRFERGMNARFEGIDVRFEGIDAKFGRIDRELKTIRDDIKTILLRLPKNAETG